MVKVLTIDSEFKSAQKLGYPTDVAFSSRWADSYDRDIVIRWGNSYLYYSRDDETKANSDFKNVVNSASSIALNCRKNEASQKMAAFVDTPKLYLGKVPKRLVVVRPFRHSHGVGFRVLQGPFPLGKDTYATEYINTKTEFRVWYVKNHFLCAKRIPKRGQIVDKYPCRSEYCYSFCKMPAKLTRQVLLAARSLGISFGAFDVLKHKRKFYFCENNTAPTIDHKKIRLFFQKYIPELLKEKFPDMEVTAPRVV